MKRLINVFNFNTIFFVLAFIMVCGNACAITLPECGRVIINQNDTFDFPKKTICKHREICPKQFDAILKYNEQKPLAKQLHFTKLHIRALKDKTWVVAHNQYQYVTLKDPLDINNIKIIPDVIDYVDSKHIRVNLNEIDAATLAFYQKRDIGVYQLSDFIAHDPQGQLCYMLKFRTTPNENIISEIDSLGINTRTLLEANDTKMTTWFGQHQGKAGIWFAGYVSSYKELNVLLDEAKNYQHLWAIIVTGRSIIDGTTYKINHETLYLSEMDYSSSLEWHHSLCYNALFVFGTKLVETNRPIYCAKYTLRSNQQ